MTREDWQEGKRLIEKVSNLSEKVRRIDNLIEWMKVATPNEKYVEIQLRKAYAHTPKAEVSILDFKSFLEGQKMVLESDIEQLEEAFKQL